MFAASRAGLFKSNSAGRDPHFGNVALLLHGDGVNGSTSIIDSGPNGLDVTPSACTISTAQSVFGGGSIFFPGGGGANTPSSPGYQFASSPFCVELFFRPDIVSGIRLLITNRSLSGGDSGFQIWIGAGKLSALYWGPSAGNTALTLNGTSTLVPFTWCHVALTRDGNTFRLFLDGVLQASGVSAASVSSSSNRMYLGQDPSTAGRNFAGYMDEMRITNGVARYVSNFIPPTAPFPNA